MRLRVTHTTRYSYHPPATESSNEVRLMPLTDSEQTCIGFRLTLQPFAKTFEYDTLGGKVHHFTIRQAHPSLLITAEALVMTHLHDPLRGMEVHNKDQALYGSSSLQQPYYDYLAPSERVPHLPEVRQIAKEARLLANESTASFLLALTRYLHQTFLYMPGATNVQTPLKQFLEQRRGVCQDFAHIMLAVCRSEGIPARYVSGYLYTGMVDPEEAKLFDALEHEWLDSWEETPLHGGTPHLISGDATHAWVECLLPNGEWCGFDPTNNMLTDTHYIKVHIGRDYSDVAPVRGSYWGAPSGAPEVAVQIVALSEGQKIAS